MAFVGKTLNRTEKIINRNGYEYSCAMALSYDEYRTPRTLFDRVDFSTLYFCKADHQTKAIFKAIFECLRDLNPCFDYLCSPGTILERDGYELYSLTGTLPGCDIALCFKSGRKYYAVIFLRFGPKGAPYDLQDRRTDDTYYGFRMRDIIYFVEEGLAYSVNHQAHTYLTWSIRVLRRQKVSSNQKKQLPHEEWLCDPPNWFAEEDTKKAQEYAKKSQAITELKAKLYAKLGVRALSNEVPEGVPITCLTYALLFTVIKLYRGKLFGAVAEVASGAASLWNFGIIASLAIDVAIAYLDT